MAAAPAQSANLTASGWPPPPPAVPAGTANLNDLNNAAIYCRDVKRQRLNDAADAQDHPAALLYKFELAADQCAPARGDVTAAVNAAFAAGGAAGPAIKAAIDASFAPGGAAGPAIKAAIDSSFAPGGAARPAIKAAIDDSFAPGGSAAIALAALEDRIQLSLRNNSVRASNMRCLLVPDLPLRPLVKELTGHPLGMGTPAGMVAPVAVGTRPPPTFPTSLTAARQFTTHAAFDEMYWFYNDPTLSPGGNLATRCRAFEDFVTG
jgi:hypothetical protein